MHHVISYYALTDQFRGGIEKKLGELVRFVPIGRLRNLGVRALLTAIRELKGDSITVAIESDSARPLAGPLVLVAALSGSKRIQVIWPDLSSEDVPRRQIAGRLARVGLDQITSRFALRSAKRQMRRLRASSDPTAAANGNAVLYLDANLSFGVAAGGSVGHTKGVIDALVQHGFEVDYASVKPASTDVAGTGWKRIAAPSLYSFPPELNYYAFNRQYERKIQEWARQRKYAFLYQRMSLHNFSGARLRKHLGIPLVLEYNGSEAWAAASWGEKLALHEVAVDAERISLLSADLVVTVSEVLGEEVAKAGVPAERILVYPNCIDPEIFDPGRFTPEQSRTLRERLGISQNALVATFIGTFGTWHGVDFLAKAIRRLIDEDRAFVEASRLHFLLVGTGLKMPEVLAEIGAEPYSRFVSLSGLVAQREAPAYLAASDIFLSPHLPNPDGSAFFGSPTKLFEYMAMERPIIASDLDQIGAVLKGKGVKKTAENPQAVLAKLFTPGSQDEFLAALRDVVRNPMEAAAMARRARAEALGAYTWTHHVGAIMERMRALGLGRDGDAATL